MSDDFLAKLDGHVVRSLTHTLEHEDHFQVISSIIDDITAGRCGFEQLVSKLGPHLTSEADAERARAANLLGEVIQGMPSYILNGTTQNHMAAFLSSRLADRPSIHGSMRGLMGILAGHALHLEQDGIVAISSALLELHIQGLAQADRMLALNVLLQLLQRYGAQLVKLEVDMLEVTIAAIDGEKDPRCLLLVFQCSQQVIKTYQALASQVPAAQKSLETNVEEMFDVMACYFPVSFTPPPNSVHSITRQELADTLQGTLTCSPLYAPLFIPLLVEKLSSSLRQAKLDALAALPAAAACYGITAIQPHLSLVWRALKAELLSPATGLPDEVQAAQQVAGKAAECLTKITAALAVEGSDVLPELVLADDQVVEDMLGCLSGPKQEGSQRADTRVQALASIIAAVVEGSQTACQMVCSQLLPKLLPLCSPSQQPDIQNHQDPALALSVILTILQAARRLVPANEGGAHGSVMLNGGQHDLLNGAGSSILAAIRTQEPSASRAAREAEQVRHPADDENDQSLMQLANTAGFSPKADEGADAKGLSANAVKPVQLQVLTELVSFPAELAVLPHQDADAALQICLQSVLRNDAESQQAEAQQAITALSQMADAGYSDLLEAQALQALMTAATATVGQSGQWQGALPLAALTALCKSKSRLRSQILQSMQKLLPALLAASVGSKQHEQMLVGVLQMLKEQLQLPVTTGDVVASDVARHLLTGMLQLTKAGQVTSREVATVCAQTMQAATASCTAEQQSPLAHLACSQLDDCCLQLHHTLHLQQQQAPPSHLSKPASDHHQTQQEQFQQQQQQQQQQSEALAGLHPEEQQLLAQSCMVASATVAGLWPDVLHMDQVNNVLQLLLRMAMGIRSSQAQHAAMVAAAAVLNKWPAGEAGQLQAALAQAQPVLHLTALSQATISRAETQPHPQSFTCLAWLIKGLYMAGHTAAYELAMLPLHFLTSGQSSATQAAQDHSSQNSPTGNDTVKVPETDEFSKEDNFYNSSTSPSDSTMEFTESASTSAAAAVYELVPAEQNSILSLSRDLAHAKVKLLWQQRFFTQSLQQLRRSLAGATTSGASTATQMEVDDGEAAETNSSAADQQDRQPSSKQSVQQEHLLVALAHLVKGTPRHVVKTALPGLVGLLLRTLDLLQLNMHSTDALLLLAVLLTVDGVLRDAAGQTALETEVPKLAASLVKLTSFNGTAQVRVVSIQCLAAMLQMPYHLLHSQKKEVLAALALAVDDNKRHVRQEAVKCRKAWASG